MKPLQLLIFLVFISTLGCTDKPMGESDEANVELERLVFDKLYSNKVRPAGANHMPSQATNGHGIDTGAHNLGDECARIDRKTQQEGGKLRCQVQAAAEVEALPEWLAEDHGKRRCVGQARSFLRQIAEAEFAVTVGCLGGNCLSICVEQRDRHQGQRAIEPRRVLAVTVLVGKDRTSIAAF